MPKSNPVKSTPRPLNIGWAHSDITPPKPVEVRGQFYARVSEETLDPLTATVLVLETEDESAVFVSCDIAFVSEALVFAVRRRLQGDGVPPPDKVIFHATHTHTGPAMALNRYDEKDDFSRGVDLPVGMGIEETVEFTAEKIAGSIREAWQGRKPGAVAFGLGRALIARNRRWVDAEGRSTMYGDIAREKFSHIEGYEDHDLNLLATYDDSGGLTGLMINVASPSQVRECLFALSADYWHETRLELRKRLGAGLFILPQCSAAGDQAPLRIDKHIYNHRAEARMLEFKNRQPCDEIAQRIADGVEEVLPWIRDSREASPEFRHTALNLKLPLNRISPEVMEDARTEATLNRGKYEEALRKLQADPELKSDPRWYVEITRLYWLARRHERVVERAERVKTSPNQAVELHLVRIGDMAVATNPFEYYLDYGIQIKARSPATQTFLAQLSGPGSYVSSLRSLEGGGYGSVPGSNIFGPDAGEILRETTLSELGKLWPEKG